MMHGEVTGSSGRVRRLMPTDQLQRGRYSMGTVMIPLQAEIATELREAANLHRHCIEQLARAKDNTVSLDTVPAGVLLYRAPNSNKIGRVYVIRLQFTHFVSREGIHYDIAPAHRPEPVDIGVIWLKPYLYFAPLPGMTRDDWREQYPAFHYNSSSLHACLGGEFRIGESETAEQLVARLPLLLTTINMTDPINTVVTVQATYPRVRWIADLAKALDAIAHGQPQDVLVRVAQLHF